MLEPPAPPGMEAAGVVHRRRRRRGAPAAGRSRRVRRAAAGRVRRRAHAVAPTHVVALPDDVDDEAAATLMLKGLTAEYLLHRTHRVRAGDTVLVHAAAGGVGSFLCAWAQGARRARDRHGVERRQGAHCARARLRRRDRHRRRRIRRRRARGDRRARRRRHLRRSRRPGARREPARARDARPLDRCTDRRAARMARSTCRGRCREVGDACRGRCCSTTRVARAVRGDGGATRSTAFRKRHPAAGDPPSLCAGRGRGCAPRSRRRGARPASCYYSPDASSPASRTCQRAPFKPARIAGPHAFRLLRTTVARATSASIAAATASARLRCRPARARHDRLRRFDASLALTTGATTCKALARR